jgi:outer membrane protein assembly factor BamA
MVLFRNFVALILFFLITKNVSAQEGYLNSDYLIVRSIKITGNNRTNEKIIKRELKFKENDTLKIAQLITSIESSKENLKNTSLFNGVNIHYIIVAGEFADFYITLEERWYFWPTMYFNHTERNFNTWWQDKDMSKIGYGAGFSIKNMRGRNEVFKLNTRFGYSTRIELAYEKIALDKARKHHLGIYYSFQIQDQLPYNTINNKPVYIKIRGTQLLYFQEMNFKYYYRPKHKIKHNAEIKYLQIEASDTIVNLNTDYLLGQNELRFFRLKYFFEYENRDFIHYPLKGQYFSFEIAKNGLKLIEPQIYNDFYINLSLIHHHPLNDRFTLSSAFFSVISENKPKPYAFTQGLGYRINLRGFEYYTVEGYTHILSQNQLKLNIIKPFSFQMNFIPSPKFSKAFLAVYLNLFADYGYVWTEKAWAEENHNTLSNSNLYSFGLGLDIVSYYDKVLRIDFAYNSLKEYGFFINFKAALHK